MRHRRSDIAGVSGMDVAQLHTDAHAQRLALLAASRGRLDAGLPSSAVFFAEALLALSTGAPLPFLPPAQTS